MTLFNKHLFNKVLYLLNSGGAASAVHILAKVANLDCKLHRRIIVSAADSFGSLINSFGYLFNIERIFSSVSFYDMSYHFKTVFLNNQLIPILTIDKD